MERAGETGCDDRWGFCLVNCGGGRGRGEQRKQKERIRGCWPGLRIRKAHAGSQWGRTRIATVPTQHRRGRRKRLQRSRRHRPNFTMPSLSVWMLDAKLLVLHSVLCALYMYVPRLDDCRFGLFASKCFEYYLFENMFEIFIELMIIKILWII